MPDQHTYMYVPSQKEEMVTRIRSLFEKWSPELGHEKGTYA